MTAKEEPAGGAPDHVGVGGGCLDPEEARATLRAREAAGLAPDEAPDWPGPEG